MSVRDSTEDAARVLQDVDHLAALEAGDRVVIEFRKHTRRHEPLQWETLTGQVTGVVTLYEERTAVHFEDDAGDPYRIHRDGAVDRIIEGPLASGLGSGATVRVVRDLGGRDA